MLTPEGLLIFFASQLVVYGLPVVALVYAVRNFRKNRRAAIAVLLIGFAPLAHYAYATIGGGVLAWIKRDVEVAFWPRKKMTPDTVPKVLVAPASWVAKTLVGVGPFERAYGMQGEQWYAFERTGNPDCPSRTEWQKYPPSQDVAKPTQCVRATEVAGPQFAGPHLRLFFENDAPSRNRPNEGRVSSSTLELRWIDGTASELVAFWENAYFDVPSFPPVLLGSKGWLRQTHYAFRAEERPDPRLFILDAVGWPRP